jgi:hypothetical protein
MLTIDIIKTLLLAYFLKKKEGEAYKITILPVRLRVTPNNV